MGSGRVQYTAWIEMLPRASQQIPFSVHPGDSVTVNIAEQTPSNWQISFANNSTGQAYQRSVRYMSSHSSAEWVVEAPSASGAGILPLDNFGSIQFSAASATENGQTVDLNQSHAQPISMLGGSGQTLAVPSSIGGDGASFNVSRTSAPATSTGRGRTGASRGVPFPNTPPIVIPFGG
jgi:Peptidase A4 family